MSNVVVLHAVEVDPGKVWYPALRDELAADGHRVEVVALPDPQAPVKEAWLQAAERFTATLDPTDTVLVGHSLGGVTVLRLLESHTGEPFAGAVLVATMARGVGYDALEPFFDRGFSWSAIRASALGCRALTALDDPVLAPAPLAHVETFVTELGAIARIEPDGGHFPSWTPDQPPTLDSLPEASALVREVLPHHG